MSFFLDACPIVVEFVLFLKVLFAPILLNALVLITATLAAKIITAVKMVVVYQHLLYAMATCMTDALKILNGQQVQDLSAHARGILVSCLNS